MEKSVEKSLEKADVEESDYYMYAYFRDRLWQVAEMVLRLKDATLVSVFVGELMELPHIGAEQERLDWLEDIYQDLLSHPEERFKAKRPIAMEDKLLLQEILDYFEVTAQALEDIPIIPVKPASQGGHRVIFKDHRAFVKR